MSVFKDYSAYYDLIYKDKDYVGEVDYIHSLIELSKPTGKTLLDIGCGTGKHAELLLKKGYSVHGFDFSADMISIANKLVNDGNKSQLGFSQGDARSFNFDKQFDIITSLFHVTSYITDNEGLEKYFDAVNRHLKPGGIFIFDFWYGPGVLTDRPATRLKEMTNDKLDITRFAYPKMYANRNVVDVNYKLIIKDKRDSAFHEVLEVHPMRYFFLPELQLLTGKPGLEITHFFDWMTMNEPGFNTWAGVIVCKKP